MEELDLTSREKIEVGKNCKSALLDLIVKEQRVLRQKWKIKWIKEGDENTAFYHKWVSIGRNKAYIFTLEDQNGTYMDENKPRFVIDGLE